MKSSNDTHSVSTLGDSVEPKENLSSVPRPASSVKKTLNVDAVSTESRRAMDTSLMAPNERSSQVSRGNSKSSFQNSESKASSGSTVLRTRRIQQSTMLTGQNASNGGSKPNKMTQYTPPPIYASSVKSRVAGRSTEIPMHLLRSGKNIVTKTITKRKNENGVTEIHITTVTRKLVDNVPSPDSKNRTVVLRTVKKGVSPTSNINLRARPAVDLSFPLEESNTVNISDTVGDVPTSLRNLRPQSISIRTNYREVDFSKPTSNTDVSQTDALSDGNKREQVGTKKINIGTEIVKPLKVKTTSTSLQKDSQITKAPRVTLPANFRRKIAVRGKAFDGTVQIPIATTTGIKSNLPNNMPRGIDDPTTKSINGETRRRTLVNTEQSNGAVRAKIDKVTKTINNETKPRELFNTEQRAKSEVGITKKQRRVKVTNDTKGIEKHIPTNETPKTITKQTRMRQRDNLKGEGKVETNKENTRFPVKKTIVREPTKASTVVPTTKLLKEESVVKDSLETSTRRKTLREPVNKTPTPNPDNQTQQKVKSQINQRSRPDFSLTNASSSHKQSNRRRKPPRPKKKSVDKKVVSKAKDSVSPLPTPAVNNLPGILLLI